MSIAPSRPRLQALADEVIRLQAENERLKALLSTQGGEMDPPGHWEDGGKAWVGDPALRTPPAAEDQVEAVARAIDEHYPQDESSPNQETYLRTVRENENTRERAKAAIAALLSTQGRETLGSIAQWCEETFGPITPQRIVTRASEEMDELLVEPDNVEEVADVVICLSRYPGLWDAVERKMRINRARKWSLKGDGTGYHIKEPS